MKLARPGWLPFAVLGFAGSFLVTWPAPDGGTDEPSLAVATTIMIAFVVAAGAWGAFALRKLRTVSPVLIAFLTPFVGALAVLCADLVRAALGLTTYFETVLHVTRYGFGAGVLAAVPFAALFALERRVGSARAGSLVDGAHRRAPWCFVGACMALASSVAFDTPRGQLDDRAALAFAAGSIFATLVTALVDVDAWLKLVRWRVPARVLVVDYGLGDEIERRASAGAAAYRDNARAEVTFVGSRARARAALRRAAALSASAFLASLVASIWAFAR